MNARKDTREKEAENEKQRQKAQDEIQSRDDAIQAKDRENRKLKLKMEDLTESLDSYELKVQQQSTQVRKLEGTVDHLQTICGETEKTSMDRSKRLEECESEIERLVKKGDWYETERRQLHNTIQVSQGPN
jgi:chromosome segregation ATPase